MSVTKLEAETVPWSSVVGGGLVLLSPEGKINYQMFLFSPTGCRLNKEINDKICGRIATLINAHDLEIEL